LVPCKISLSTKDHNQLQLSLVEKMQAVYGGKADRASAMVRVSRATQGERYKIVLYAGITSNIKGECPEERMVACLLGCLLSAGTLL
jgi:hypothetical protein